MLGENVPTGNNALASSSTAILAVGSDLLATDQTKSLETFGLMKILKAGEALLIMSSKKELTGIPPLWLATRLFRSNEPIYLSVVPKVSKEGSTVERLTLKRPKEMWSWKEGVSYPTKPTFSSDSETEVIPLSLSSFVAAKWKSKRDSGRSYKVPVSSFKVHAFWIDSKSGESEDKTARLSQSPK